MPKFTLPPSIAKLSRTATPPWNGIIFPMGTLYHHTASNTYFRFIVCGGRWETLYGISTDKGALTGTRIGNEWVYSLELPPAHNELVTRATKQQLLEIFLQAVE